MRYNFINVNTDPKEFLKSNVSGVNKFLLENNTCQLEQVQKFLTGDDRLLLVQGYSGTGKSSLIEHVEYFLNSECIILKYTCFETSIVDDLLLSFFDDFKKLEALGKIVAPNIKVENFTQKINSYFQSIEHPILVVIESLEEILEFRRSEFYDFINHLLNYQDIKVILTGKVFKLQEFTTQYAKTSILALDKNIFERYLRSEDCKQIGAVSDELYKITRGYFFYVTLSLKIMKLKQLSLIQFIESFSHSFLSFNDFILREALSLVDPISGHLIRFLTIIRHPVSVKLLKTLQLWNEERVSFFIDNLLLSRFGEYIYIKSFYKEIAENSIHPSVAIKLHKNCVELYKAQLPLKPFERYLLISRQTMRNEIEFHSNFIPQEVVIQKVNEEVVQVLEPTVPVVEEKVPEKPQIFEKISFTFDDAEVIDKIAGCISDYISLKAQEKEIEQEDNKLSLTELMNLAKQEEQNFNYKHAISLYTKALLKQDDDNYYTFLPVIYSKLASNYQNISDWLNALKYFEELEGFYRASGDIEQVNSTRYNIAYIYYTMFKVQKSVEILEQIEKEHVSDNLRIKVLNLLANLSQDDVKAYDLYSRAIELVGFNTDKQTLSELYYKFAAVCDGKGDYRKAMTYYKKCTEITENNSYFANACFNIAAIYDETGKSELALKYYNESLDADVKANNLGGMYNSYMKLAEIYFYQDADVSVEYYDKAFDTAKKLNDKFYLIMTATGMGDLFFKRGDLVSALKYYKIADENLQGSDVDEATVIRIKSRINTINREGSFDGISED